MAKIHSTVERGATLAFIILTKNDEENKETKSYSGCFLNMKEL